MINVKNIFKLIILAIVTAVCGIFSFKYLGIKDGATFTLSVVLTIIIIILSIKDIKKAIYLFIIAMPILVTARKGLYLDFFIMKLNFESIIIVFLFVTNIKKIALKVNEKLQDKRNKIYSYSLILFVLGSYISCLFSKDYLNSIKLTTTSVLIPILLGVLVVSIFNKKDIKNIVYSLIISVNLSCLYGGIQILGIGLSLSAIKGARGELTFGYHNVNIFVNIALMVFPLLLNELLYKKNDIKKNIFLILSILLQGGAIFITFSRGAWLALGIAGILVLFSRKYKYVFIGITILALVAMPYVLPKVLGRGDSSSHFLTNTSNTARMLSIITSTDVMKDNILGVGFGNFNSYYRENVADAYLTINYELRKYMAAPLYTMEHAHNFFLNIGVELGIVSLLAILLIFIDRINKSIRNYSANRGIFVALIIFIFIGLTTGIELNHKGVVTNTYILWILFSMLSLNNKEEQINIKEACI